MQHEPARPRGHTRRPWLLAASVLAGLMLGVYRFNVQPAVITGFLATPILLPFTDTDDAAIQQRELASYVEAYGHPNRILQVDLERHPKISQFTNIDSSSSGYGKNACGLVAAAAALGGDDWVSLVDTIARAAGKDYGRYTGIQPSKYAAALQNVFGADHVSAKDKSSLGDLYQELEAGHIVIVDIKVRANGNLPSANRPNYAHFARVLGLDVDKKEVYIENTLRRPYWTLSLDSFLATWIRAETTVSLIPDPQKAEDVTRWMVTVDSLVNDS